MTSISSAERAELVRLVNQVTSAQCTEQEQDEALHSLESRLLHPRVSTLIFFPDQEGFDHELTAEEAVEAALAYRPIEL